MAMPPELAERRGRLRERIAAERARLARDAMPLGALLVTVDHSLAMARKGMTFVRQHPYTVGALVATAFLFKPRYIWRATQLGLIVWRTWRGLRTRFFS